MLKDNKIWRVGNYVVTIKHGIEQHNETVFEPNLGTIARISRTTPFYTLNYIGVDCFRQPIYFNKDYVKPFRTLEDAEEYSKRIKALNGKLFYTRLNELNKNKYYHVDLGEGFTYISDIFNNTICCTNKSLWKNHTFEDSKLTIYTELSKKDTEWFTSCIKAGKYLEKKIISNKISLNNLNKEDCYYMENNDGIADIIRFKSYNDKYMIFYSLLRVQSDLYSSNYDRNLDNENCISEYEDYNIIRKATNEEQEWLFKCEQENRFVLLEKTKQTSLISEHIDYYVRTWPSGTKTMGCDALLEGIKCFKSLETYDKEGGVIKDHVYGLLMGAYSTSLHQATQEEIDYFLKNGTLITFNNESTIPETSLFESAVPKIILDTQEVYPIINKTISNKEDNFIIKLPKVPKTKNIVYYFKSKLLINKKM